METVSGRKRVEKPTVLVVDDEDGFRRVAKAVLSESYRVVCVESGEKAIEDIGEILPQVVLLDVCLPGVSGIECIEPLRKNSPRTIVIMITGVCKNIPTAVQAMNAGAHNFLEKPIGADELFGAIDAALASRLEEHGSLFRKPIPSGWGAQEIWGKNPRFLDCIRVATDIAGTGLPVLIEGETGTGKELFARLIHSQSPFSEGEFADVNCGTLSLGLCATDLFGHEKGAFTGAEYRRLGAFDKSMKGTLFLDEIGDLSLGVQPALLRALQEKEFTRVGGEKKIPWDGRLICATNQDIEAMVKMKTFRLDLFHRIQGCRIKIPPLRERHDDIPVLAGGFLCKYGSPGASFGPGMMEALTASSWPGNVRELKFLIQRLFPHEQCKEVGLGALEAAIPEWKSKSRLQSAKQKPKLTLKESTAVFECEVILQCLDRNGQDKEKAAMELGISTTTLDRKLRKRCL